MEILVLLLIIVLCIVGMTVTGGLKIAAQEAQRVGDALVEESKRVQAEFDAMVREAIASQKPQTNDVAERLVYRMEFRKK
jgi:hypothetical protein